jgi:ATP-dependent Clp protease protease subunit
MPDLPYVPPGQSDDPSTDAFGGLTRHERRTEIRQISYYLSGSILQSSYYNELFYTLRTATETDLIYLHLNTCGGDFDTGLQIINNMMASNAHVIAVLEARAYSMGAFIFLAADEMVVHDNCQLLFHSYSGVFSGKGNEQQAQGLALANWFEKFMERICQPFLSTNEIKGILKGADMWMDSDEIRHRMARMQRAQEKLLAPHSARTGPAQRAGHAPLMDTAST